MVRAFSNNMGCNNIIGLFVIVITVSNLCFCSKSRRSSSLSESSRAQLNVELYTGPETILSKQISYEGVSLIIGSNYERELKTSEPIYKCSLTDLPEGYTGPELLERPRSYRINPSEERSSNHSSDYFFHFFREFWLCRDPTNAKQPVFYKVVNQLISVRDIFEIKYYPYIEVATVDYLGSNKNSAKIKEIKFMYNDGGRFYNLKFDSKLIDEIVMDQTVHKPQTNPSFNEYAHSIEPMRVGSERAVKDFLFTPNDKPRKLINISPAGMNLRIGSTWHKKFEGGLARTTNEYICRREYGLDFPHIFTPECSVKHKFKNSEESIYAKVTAEDFPRMFTVANREVWLCTNNVSRHI
ncbi:uncharacterized protein LOC111047297 [Nilaparvata lugens]|uniref:uncharacterized protein LOC111047297 n=1 Tax=Nilaparvata lugens TaxID=108931 RepID=UPI00193CA82E|nr:uncharacterized protein LOC111047297 [Nilaparvata lugens]